MYWSINYTNSLVEQDHFHLKTCLSFLYNMRQNYWLGLSLQVCPQKPLVFLHWGRFSKQQSAANASTAFRYWPGRLENRVIIDVAVNCFLSLYQSMYTTASNNDQVPTVSWLYPPVGLIWDGLTCWWDVIAMFSCWPGGGHCWGRFETEFEVKMLMWVIGN